MSIALIYISKHGTVRKIAERIKDGLHVENIELFNLKENKKINPENYEIIILGGSIHAGTIQKGLRKFVDKNLSVLLRKKIFIFIACMEKSSKRDEYLKNAFPIELLENTLEISYLGGEFLFDKMNFIEKKIIKKISGKSEDVNEIDNEAIESFINKIKKFV